MVGLRVLLCREIEVADQLLALLDDERQAIVLNQVERLARAVADKQVRVDELAKLEAERLELLAPLAARRGVAPAQVRAIDLDADEALVAGDRAGLASELNRLIAELTAKLRLIERANRDNSVLLSDALEAVGMTLSVIQRVREGEQLYDRAGRSRQRLKRSGAVDRRL